MKKHSLAIFIVSLLVCICLFSIPAVLAQSNANEFSNSNVQWEYLVLYEAGSVENRMETLNEYGEEGWELVSVEDQRFYLKRKR